jgi:hypothetical protein
MRNHFLPGGPPSNMCSTGCFQNKKSLLKANKRSERAINVIKYIGYNRFILGNKGYPYFRGSLIMIGGRPEGQLGGGLGKPKNF